MTNLKLTVRRSDIIPAFGAWHHCGECEFDNTILLNLEAIFGECLYSDGTVAEMTNQDRKEVLLDTLMHEFGHALEQSLGLEIDEVRLERIIASYHKKKKV